MSHTIFKNDILECDLTVIGAGLAGMASSLYAANRNLSTIQIGDSGGLQFTSGLFDLMGVYPDDEIKSDLNPWTRIESYVSKNPEHPYGRLKKEKIKAAFNELLDFFKKAGITYHFNEDRNFEIITGAGTVKQTYSIQETMRYGVTALEKKEQCMIVNFCGFKEYSAVQAVETLLEMWPGLRPVKIKFPDTENLNELFAGHMARAMEFSETREKLALEIKPEIKESKAVGIPAVLGVYRTREIFYHLKELLGVPVFEIPTMPASVPGIRLKKIFETHLGIMGVNRLVHKKVKSVSFDNGYFYIHAGDDKIEQTIRSKGIILATGRFRGRGLIADRNIIRESIFNLPVTQPDNRSQWHKFDFLDPEGHPVNRAGLETDDKFRPVDKSGNPAFKNLYAAGSILAHNDWMRLKCGTGVSVSTAYAAVNAFIDEENIRGTQDV